MLLERLILHHFKRFRDQEIRFNDGITGIIGNNGTGKSSIVEGILFALYGLSGSGIKGDYIVSTFAEPRERCEVRLDFRVQGQTYTVRRSFRKANTIQHEAWLNRGERLLAQGVTEVDQEVTRILGMNATDLKHTIYAGQKDLVALLESRPGERREWFSRVLGIDYLKDESLAILKGRIDQSERARNRLEGELSTLARLVEGENAAVLKISQEELENTLLQYQEVIAMLGAEIRNQEARLTALQQEKFHFTRLTERKNATEKELEALTRRKTSLEQELASLEGKVAEYEHLRKEMETYPAEKERYARQQKVKARFDHLTQELQFAQKQMTDLERRLGRQQEKEKEYADILHQQSLLRENLRKESACPDSVDDATLERWIHERERTLAQQVGSLHELLEGCGRERGKILLDWETIRKAGQDGECPLCHQRLGEHYPLLEEEFESRLQDIVMRGEEACEVLERYEKERSHLAALSPHLDELRARGDLEKVRVSLAEDRQSLDRERAQVLKERDQVNHQIKDLAFDEVAFSDLELKVQASESRYRHLQEAEKLIATLPVLRHQMENILQEETSKHDERDGIQQALEESVYDPTAEEQLQSVLHQLREESKKNETNLARDQERLAKILENLNRLQEIQTRISEVERKRVDHLEEIRLLKLTRSAVSDFVIYLMQVVRAQIEQTAGEVLSTITDERYDRVLLDSDFNLRISDLDNDYPIERFSGGEQDDIAVAVRIALSRYLAELHQIHDSTFLIFDEIFGSQDEERRNNLLRALRTQESHFPQIILISHIPEIQGEFATTLVVEMDTDQTSVVREAS
jgi:exonuclease SbcC